MSSPSITRCTAGISVCDGSCADAAQRRAAAEYADLMADFAAHPERYAHAAWNDCAYGCTDGTCAHYTYKLDGVAYVHKSLSARYAQTPLCGFTGDGDSLHGDDAYVTCPDCIAAR